MKKIFTLISVALVAMSVNAQTDESYVAVDADGNMSVEYASIIDENNVATNVVNGNSVVKFSTANVEVEAVGSAEPADKEEGGQDITIGAQIDEALHLYELVSINSTKVIKWEKKNQGDINFSYIAGTGVPAVSMVAEEIYTEGEATGKYRVVYTTFDPEKGGEPQSGLYYKFTTKADGALKVGIWANKNNRTTFLVDSETKQATPYLVEGYINGQNGEDGKKKWLSLGLSVPATSLSGATSSLMPRPARPTGCSRATLRLVSSNTLSILARARRTSRVLRPSRRLPRRLTVPAITSLVRRSTAPTRVSSSRTARRCW